MMNTWMRLVVVVGIANLFLTGIVEGEQINDILAGNFYWKTGGPVLAIDTSKLPPSTGTPWCMVKDPSIVYYQGRWHLFCTVKREGSGSGRIRIGYMSFTDFQDAQDSQWHLIDLYNPGVFVAYHGAPQIFYFTPQSKWYLIYQLADTSSGIPYGPCYSTTDDISDPASWTMPTPLYPPMPDNAGLDHWVICDDSKAYHFFTSLNGKMWRTETKLSDFPSGWIEPTVALQSSLFEASHTYKIKGLNKYLTVAVALGSGNVGRRYYLAYLADQLDGIWQPVAATKEKSFASLLNVTETAPHWAVGIDHGELIRSGFDEKLEIDPDSLRFLFQSEITNTDHKLGLLIDYDTNQVSISCNSTNTKIHPHFFIKSIPAHSFVTIQYSVMQSSNVEIEIYNPAGYLITTLYSGYRTSGNYTEIWHGKDNHGYHVTNGMYLVKFTKGSQEETLKLTFMR